MAKQIQIGKDKLVFSKVQNLANCEVTPTPTPTPACLTVNLDTQVTCNEYSVVDSYQPSSSSKLMDAIVVSDNSIVACGTSLCGSITNTTSVTESVICKNKIKTTTKDGVPAKVIDLDETFSKGGKISQPFYGATNLKVPSKFNCIISQIASGQNKLIAAGDNDNRPLIARYLLSSGAADRTFGFNTGYVTLDNISDNNIRLINVFGLAIQTDNKIVVFCNAYDTVNKHSVCIILRLTNSGAIDSTFNQNKGFISLRSTLPEFDGNKIIGTRIKKQDNTIYLILESFSSVKNNTVILAKYLLNEASLDNTFGEQGFVYINIDDKNTYYQNLFSVDSILYVVANSQNKKLHVIPYQLNGTKSTTKQTLEISNQIFSITEEGTNSTGFLTVNFINMPCDEIMIDNNIVLPININVLSNSIDTLGSTTNSGFHWFEKQALAQANVEYNSVTYRDCSVLPCDRQPHDSYGTLSINDQRIKKYYTPARILYGFIAINKDISSASPIRLDRFDSLVPHNVLKSVLLLDNNYVAVGYSGDNFYSTLCFKTVNLSPNTSSFGPQSSDISNFVNFDDTCKTSILSDEFVVEECPCAPTATPTPTPTPILPTSDVYISSIIGECQGDSPILSVTWTKNVADLVGSYVLQIVRNSADKPEILAGTFDIARNNSSGIVTLELSQLAPELNNRTCIASIVDNAGNVVHSKIFVMTISSC